MTGARRTLRGIDEQVAKAQRAVDGHAPVKRNRYIQDCLNNGGSDLGLTRRAVLGGKD
jgi:hypothetical protein